MKSPQWFGSRCTPAAGANASDPVEYALPMGGLGPLVGAKDLCSQ